MRPARFVFSAASTAAVANGQTTAGAATLVLNGSAVGPVQPGIPAFAQFDLGVTRPVTLTSTGALSGVNFTIVGFDANNGPLTEVLAGPSNNTVATTAEFNRVTSITTSGAVGTSVSAGSGTTGHTNWYAVDYFQSPISVGLWLQVTATLSATVQLTPDAFIQTATAPHAFNHGYLTAVTADAASELPYGARGVRAAINSSSGSGALVFTIIQSGAGVV